MGQLDYFNIEIRPWVFAGQHGGEEKLYKISVQVDGEKYAFERPGGVPPYMTQLEYLTRLSLELRDKLAPKD